MAINTISLIRPTISGLDNMPMYNSTNQATAGGLITYNNALDTGGMVTGNNLSSISPSPTQLGVSSLFSSISVNKAAASANTETTTEQEIQSLAKSVNTQEARIAAGTGSNIATQYLEDEKKDSENFITKILNVLDAPRNAIMNGFKYAASMGVGNFFEGFWNGLTRKEVYSGYDFAEDMGLPEGTIGNTLVGFTTEMFLDPLNWITWGTGSFAKGFAQGAVKDVAKETAEQTVKTGIRELGQQAIKEGGEAAAEKLVTSGIKSTLTDTAKQTGEQLAQEAATQTVKNVKTGAGGLLNSLANKLDEIENTYGLTFGNGKLQAAYKQAINVASSTGKIADGLSDDVLTLARAGNYGDDIQNLAEAFVRDKQALIGADDAARTTLESTIKQTKKTLLEELEPYKLQLRYDALAAKGVDASALKNGISSMYEDTMAGALKSLESKHNVDNVGDLMDAIAKETGEDVTEKTIYTNMVKEGFGNRVLSNIDDRLLKYGDIEKIRTTVLDNLVDTVAADQLYNNALKKGMKELGTSLGFNVPFTNIRKDIQDANTMFELGAKARAIIGTKITANGLEPTLAGRALDDIGKGVGALFSHLPIIGKALDESNRLEKTNRWALKFIEQSTRGKAKLSAEVAENSIEDYYKTLKDAGFKSSDELNDVGNFISSAIESRQLGKNESIDDWLNKIKGFTEMDDATINNKVNERLLEIEARYKENPQSLVDEFGANLGESFDDYYNKVKTGLTNEYKRQSDLKNILLSYDEKKQKAVLNVTKGIAEDFDNIGRTLAELRLIPDNRMLEAEYWYFPHKMSLDLMLENSMDIDRTIGSIRTTGEAAADAANGVTRGMRQILGGKTERFTLRDVSTWQRKYPMSTVEVNKILKNKYAIDHMLETNAFNTYLLYALDQGKVIADAGEVNDILHTFGFRVNSKDMIPILRSKGYTIVTRNSNVNAMQVSENTLNAIENYNAKAKQLNELYKKVRGVRRDLSSIQGKAENTLGSLAKQINNTSQVKATAKSLNKELKDIQNESMKAAKGLVKDSNYVRDIIAKGGVLPDGMDEDLFNTMMDSIINNEFMRGNSIYATDTLGNQAMPAKMATNALRKEDGLPQIFMGNIDDIGSGFRNVPKAVDTVTGDNDFYYIVSKKPFDIPVDDLKSELSIARNKYTDEMKQEYLAKGYDSFRLTDGTGATAVIPFDETNVFYINNAKQATKASKYQFAKDVANTTKGGFVNPSKVFVPDQTRINVKDIPYRKRKALSDLLDADYLKTNAAMNERDKLVTANNKLINKYTKELNDHTSTRDMWQEMTSNYLGKENREDFARVAKNVNDEQLQIDNLNKVLADLDSQNKNLLKQNNNIKASRQYNFIAGLKRAKGFDTRVDSYVTAEELYNMLGANKDAGLVSLGYDTVLDHVDDAGKQIYRALPNATQMSKQDLVDLFDVNMALINSDAEASSLVKLITDNGTGRDALAKVINDYANSNNVATLKAIKARLQRVADFNTKDIEELENLPIAKKYSQSQANLIARMASSDNFLTELTDDKQIEDMFNIADTMTTLSKTDRDIWALPSNIVEYFNKGIKKQTDQGVALLKDIMWKFNKIWKPSVTAWRPSFGIRNLMSGYFNSFMYAGKNLFDPEITKAALQMVTGKNLDDVVELGGNKYTLKQLKQAMILNGASNGLVVTDVSSIGEMLANQLKKVTNPKAESAWRHPLKTMEKINSGVEDYNRSLLYLAAVKNGETLEYAGDLVKKLQFDYSDLSDFEKKIKTIMPFYTWMRNNIPLQIERFLDDPRLYMLLMKRVPDAAKEASGMSDEEWDNMPDWVKGTFPIALGKDSDTGRYRLFDTTLPYQDLASLGGVQDMFSEVVSLLHPMIKTPVELFLNKNLYTGAALESYEGATAEQAIQGTANPVLNAIAKVAPNALRSMPRYYCSS